MTRGMNIYCENQQLPCYFQHGALLCAGNMFCELNNVSLHPIPSDALRIETSLYRQRRCFFTPLLSSTKAH